ncbi:MAG: LytTR family transcriptional regulator DNA-binding domain-containing protein [Patiriisocius sp.]|uniref:LytTR family transcriptional regulator DNA-binding domain-containing protein n=1 Tax=Patiriisocius sp. TaxID=2822396 RepID=UPI003EF7C8A3
MRYFYLIFFLIFSSIFNIQAQSEQQYDSIYQLGLKHRRSPDSLQKYGRFLLLLDDSKRAAISMRGYYYLGQAESLKGEIAQSIVYYDSALVSKQGVPDSDFQIIATLMRNKGISYSRLGKTEAAKKAFNELITLAKTKNLPIQLAPAYNDLGITEKNTGNFKKAIELYTNALRIYDSLGNYKSMSATYLNMGVAEANLKNLNHSNESFKKVIYISLAHENNRDLYRAYNNLSVNYNSLNQPDSALFYLRKIVPYYKNNKDRYSEYLAYKNLGTAHSQLKTNDSVLFYLNKSIKGFKEMNIPEKIGEGQVTAAIFYYDQSQLNKAQAYADSAVNNFQKSNHAKLLADTYNLLSNIHESKKDFEKANEYIKKSKQIEDSIYTAENNKNLNKILTELEVKEKDLAIDNLEGEKSFYKSTFFIATLLSLVLLLFFYLLYRRYQDSNKELISLREKMEYYHKKTTQKSATMLALKSKAVVKTEELLYVKSDSHYLEFYTKDNNKPEIDRNALKDVLEQLKELGFAQIHKSYIVNLDYIRIINSTKIMLTDGTWLPLSRTYKPRLKEILLHTSEEN